MMTPVRALQPVSSACCEAPNGWVISIRLGKEHWKPHLDRDVGILDGGRVMGYLVVLALLAVGYLVVRGLLAPTTRKVTRHEATNLERDPRTGVYRPSEHDGS